MQTHSRNFITKLSPTEVFVFGTNAQGFHGAKAAGYAFKGTADNDWRTNVKCQQAINAAPGDPKRIGKWAVWGIARGLMIGHEGKSYGVVTTYRPGEKGPITIQTITKEVTALAEFATNNPHLTFLCAPFGLNKASGGGSWFTFEEIRGMYATLDAASKLPDNLLLPEKFKVK